jgi:O-antigen ligase
MNFGRLRLSGRLEKAFVVAAFVLATLPGWQSADAPPGHEPEQKPLVQVIWAVDYLLVFAMLALRRSEVLPVIARSRLLWAMLLWVLMSAGWSAEPAATLRHGIALTGTTLFGIYVATRFSLDEQLPLAATALTIVAMLSLAVALVLPKYGIAIDDTGIMWQGIYATKNVLGRWMALAVVVMFLGLSGGRWRSPTGSRAGGKRPETSSFQSAPLSGRFSAMVDVPRPAQGSIVPGPEPPATGLPARRATWPCGFRDMLLAAFGFLLAVGLLWLTRSRTAQLACLSVLGLSIFYRVLRWHALRTMSLLMYAAAAGGTLLTWIIADPKVFLGAMGKSSTLTNRIPLWGLVLEAIGKRPWLGYGYSSFWQGWHGDSAHICRVAGWIPPHAHNGFLDVCLDLGLVGLTIFLLGVVFALCRAVRSARRTTTVGGLWPITFLTFLLLYNLTESLILRQHNLFWLLYVAATLSRPEQAAGQSGVAAIASEPPPPR